MTSPIPTPEDQVYFLRNIQRLLAEGQFVASYSFCPRSSPGRPLCTEGRGFGDTAGTRHEGHRRKVRGIILATITALSANHRNIGADSSAKHQRASVHCLEDRGRTAHLWRIAISTQTINSGSLVRIGCRRRSSCPNYAAVETADRWRRAVRFSIREFGPWESNHFEGWRRLLFSGFLRINP